MRGGGGGGGVTDGAEVQEIRPYLYFESKQISQSQLNNVRETELPSKFPRHQWNQYIGESS